MPKRSFKQLVKSSPLYPRAQGALEEVRARRELGEWAAAGGVGPPPHLVKQGVVRAHARRYRIDTLIETGTYLGGMIHAIRKDFRRIHTIEVDRALYEQARNRFARQPHVTVHHGDSGVVISEILRELSGPALFWLDGHYSGGVTSMGAKETPIVEEVTALLEHGERRHVILIDDARCFGTSPDYPQIDEFRGMVSETRPDLAFAIEHDIIRLTPPE